MEENCLFCKIAEGEIPTKIIYENDLVLAFNDINPQAPHHILIIPKKHIPTVNDIEPNDQAILLAMIEAAQTLALKLGVKEKGYRLVMNCHEDAGQAVFHLHMHLLAGRQMSWPPG